MLFDEVLFLERHHVAEAHDASLRVAGGADGVHDDGLLESAVMAPRSGYYGSLAEMAAVYAHGIIKNHAFIGGNKRTAFFAAVVFLELNGFALTYPAAKWVAIMEGVADSSVSRDQLAAHFADAMGGDPISIEE